MNVVGAVSAVGGSRPNEDRYGHTDTLAWVIDGATDLEPDSFLPATSDVQWLADQVGGYLRQRAVTAGLGAREVLTRISGRIGADLRELGFPPDRIHPTCSIGLLVVGGEALEMCRVGDPTCVALGRQEVTLSTDFFSRQESRAVGAAGSLGLDDREVRRGIVERRQQYIEGQLAESVFSGHPNATLTFQSARLAVGSVSHVLLCSDGFARAVVDYRLYRDWRTLVLAARDQGLPAVAEAIRAHEKKAVHLAAAGHFKKSDDATAIIISV
ncbi:protein phosphatase 2C domain-containing protein [Streptomyces sp. NBC_01476]|uniref:protein phosphatase 2C domain-containing protein n=1 Tax=Streptomyces sp. NBC_01476 TaxID=2903881 RepID=UPI002E356204|nr:protein phosphatase 2C domain-containing protein [Streptomyces sp. NBC_01476]